MSNLQEKIESIKEEIRGYQQVAVAFSGGKDSFFLLLLALEALGEEQVEVFFVRTAFSTQNDELRINYYRDRFKLRINGIYIDVSGIPEVVQNTRERCYYCKTRIFAAIREQAHKLKISTVLDGTTSSDLNEYRPGLKALEELGIKSPLRKANITSGEIVKYLKRQHQVEDYYLTSSTCLATRFPYSFPLEETILRIFDEIEHFLVGQRIFPIKIRFIKDGIRIETHEKNFLKIIEMRDDIIGFCHQRGLKFITLDIEGIKTGPWD